MNPNAWVSRAAAFLLLALAVAERPASAQPAGYVSVNGFADIRQFGTSGGGYYLGSDADAPLDATGAGGGLRVGTFLHPRWSLELGADVASRETVDLDQQAVILIYPPPPRLDLKASTRFTTVSTMVGFHPPALGRVRLAYRAGFSFVRAVYASEYPGYPGYPMPTAIFSESRGGGPVRLPPIILPPPRIATITQKHNTGALTLGFDAAIDVTDRLAVAPEVRALVFSTPGMGPGVFLIRPGVGVRWKF